MSEEIYRQVEDAIARRLHVGVHRSGRFLGSMTWRYPAAIEDGEVIVRDSDCGEVKPVMRWSPEKWAHNVSNYGLWRKVGMWDFVPADDPAADDIRRAHRNPEAAGREIYRLKRKLEELREQTEAT